MIGKSMAKKNTISLVLVTTAALLSQSLWADEEDRRQAKRIHDRLTGVPATNAIIDDMEDLLEGTSVNGYAGDTSGKTAAQYAIDTAQNPNARYFYNVTLKNFAAPWTNEEQTVFTSLNDYTATVIGLVRDESDFRQVLHGNVIYRGNNGVVPGLNTPYRNDDNAHYVQLEGLGPVAGDLSDNSVLIADTQSNVTGLPGTATAGVMTTRAGAMSFFSDGTNRAMFRFTLMNHLCTDLEPLKDVSRTPDRIRQDVSRSPGGDSRIFLNSCIGCHAGMDGMAGAFAYYEWDYTNDKTDGSLTYTGPEISTPPVVSQKHLINPDNFKPGYQITDDSWVNYWRNGQNWSLGWGTAVNPDAKGNETGSGAKSLGQELANSDAFAQCQVDKVFEAVCLRSPTEFFGTDRTVRDDIVADFKTTYNYNMREVFTDVAAHCKGN
jgi:hypothetical protein